MRRERFLKVSRGFEHETINLQIKSFFWLDKSFSFYFLLLTFKTKNGAFEV